MYYIRARSGWIFEDRERYLKTRIQKTRDHDCCYILARKSFGE
jgi:hypothetical protein